MSETNWESFVGGYPIELEDRDTLMRTSTEARFCSYGDLPVRVDPRTSPLHKLGWMVAPNQFSIGSCQGNALTHNMEYCYAQKTGKVLQFSRMYAYIASQIKSNIKGDRGSTLTGGTEVALEGIPTEDAAPYTERYPGWEYITPAMKEAAKGNCLETHTVISSVDALKQYTGSMIGIVQIGIPWNDSMRPDSNGCIRSFSGGGGGHSVVYAGYVPDSDVGAKSSAGYWFLMLNSWGKQWGKDGWAYVDPRSVEAQMRHSWSVFIGRSDLTTPGPRVVLWKQARPLG